MRQAHLYGKALARLLQQGHGVFTKRSRHSIHFPARSINQIIPQGLNIMRKHPQGHKPI
nr:MAG TPA: hypothetical protein [Caudoviricetes sp.]